MIRHIVFFSAKDKNDLADVLAGLRIRKDIPHALRLEVEPNIHKDAFSNDVDVVVYGEFADEAELAAYQQHPLYQESIALVRPLRELRIAGDIVSN